MSRRDVPPPTRQSAGPPVLDPLAAVRADGDPRTDVFLTGTVFLDIIFTGLDTAPVRGTESWARGMGSSPGGVANMATALARLGLHTSLAAAFGDDMYGEYCWDALAQGEGIDLSLSRTVPGWHSPVTVSMAYEGERTMVSHGHEAPPSEAAFDSRHAPGCPPPSRACVTSLVPGRREEWLGCAAGRGSRIFADVGWDDTGRWDPADLAGLEHCEAFLPNAEEAMRYTRTDCPRAAARKLAERVPLAVVTMGAEGACAVDGRTGESAEVPAITVEELDPTGAGDVFVAGFITGTLAGWPLTDRLSFAGLTAALSVQEFGGSLSAPGWAEIACWWQQVRDFERRAGGGAAAPAAPPLPVGPATSAASVLPGAQDPAVAAAPATPAAAARLRHRYAFLDTVLPTADQPSQLARAVPTIGFRRPA